MGKGEGKRSRKQDAATAALTQERAVTPWERITKGLCEDSVNVTPYYDVFQRDDAGVCFSSGVSRSSGCPWADDG